MTYKTSNKILVLDSDNSLVLPHFDTDPIVNYKIYASHLSLYVLDVSPSDTTRVHIVISPIDLNTNKVGNGVSTFLDVMKHETVNFILPPELFSKHIKAQHRFLVQLMDKDKRILFSPPDTIGTIQDPKLIIVHDSEIDETQFGNITQIVKKFNYINIPNSQLHFGSGDNVGKGKVENRNSEPFSLWTLLVGIATIASTIIAILEYLKYSST